MENQNIETFRQVLDELAARFGTAGAELWSSFVAYEMAMAAATILVLPIATAILFVVSLKFKSLGDADTDRYNSGEGYYTVAFISGVVGVVVGLIWLGFLPDGIATILAPEAAVIKGLLTSGLPLLALSGEDDKQRLGEIIEASEKGGIPHETIEFLRSLRDRMYRLRPFHITQYGIRPPTR